MMDQLARLAITTTIAVVLATVSILAVVLVAAPGLGYEAIVIRGPSMEPEVPVGALTLVDTSRRDPVAGQIITIRRPSGVLVTHRVISVEGGGEALILKGDANEDPDASPVPRSAVVGTVAQSVPLAGYLVFLLRLPSGILGVLSLLGSLLLARRLMMEPEEGDRRSSAPPIDNTPGASRAARSGLALLLAAALALGSAAAARPARAVFTGPDASTDATFGTASQW